MFYLMGQRPSKAVLEQWRTAGASISVVRRVGMNRFCLSLSLLANTGFDKTHTSQLEKE